MSWYPKTRLEPKGGQRMGIRVSMRVAVVGMVVCGLTALAGCGVQVDLTSTPSQVTQGQPVNFTLKVTNPSKCPVGNVEAALIPFFPVEEISLSSDPSIDTALHEGLQGLCTNQPFQIPGYDCNFVSGDLVCNPTSPDTTAPTSGPIPLSSPASDILSCEHQGSQVVCKIRPLSQTMGASVSGNTIALPACVPLGNDYVICLFGDLAPGASSTTDIAVPAGRPRLRLDNFFVAEAGEQGVCKDGSRAGQPCNEDADCTGGSMGSCATGICIDNTTQATGNGCATNMDCGMNETCTQCRPNQQNLTDIALACTQTDVLASAPAPVMSRWGLAAAVIALLGVAMVGLRFRPRFR